MGRGWADIYLIKGVSGALVLTIRELRKLICQSRTKQQETSHGCVLYTALIDFERFCRSLSRVLSIYVHRRGAFGVARFDNLGDARAFTAWNE